MAKDGSAAQACNATASIDEVIRTVDYIQAQMRDKRLKLEPYEIVALINLNPNSAAAAKSLIPSLEKLTDDEVDNDILRRGKGRNWSFSQSGLQADPQQGRCGLGVFGQVEQARQQSAGQHQQASPGARQVDPLKPRLHARPGGQRENVGTADVGPGGQGGGIWQQVALQHQQPFACQTGGSRRKGGASARVCGRAGGLAGGVVIVTTSNRPPEDLYRNGLNRASFLPFIALLETRFLVRELVSPTDYRQHRLSGQQVYFHPAGRVAAQIDAIWTDLTGGAKGDPLKLPVNGRTVTVPRFANGVGRASFWDLCAQPLGPADYLAIAEAVRVLILEDIPQLSSSNYNEAKRFVTLIDALYEGRVKLVTLAAAALLTTAGSAAAAPAPRGEVIYDTYGVPHVYGKDEASMFYGFGYATMKNHGNLVLKLYAEARGRAQAAFQWVTRW